MAKWVKKDSQFETNAKGTPTRGARISGAIVQKRNDAKAEEAFKAKVVPAKAKDKGTNKRR